MSTNRSERLRVFCLLRLAARLHRQQDGTISILTVFTVLLLTMLLGMVMNVGRHVDGKIRLQNAADAAAYSGGLVIARGMNTLAFTNHLLCDVFALTAYLREARDRNAEKFAPAVLAAWNKAGQTLATSNLPKFVALGQAIQQKVAEEQEMVRTFSEWGAALSAAVLPVLEQILREEAIPEYQRAVVEAFPDIAQRAAMEVAGRHGEPDYRRGKLLGVLWRTHVVPVGGEGEAAETTLPAEDPTRPGNADYRDTAQRQRHQLSHRYLDDWNRDSLAGFDYHYPTWQYNTGWMSQFYTSWRSFTCGQLDKLLNEEYPDRNLPHVIRQHAVPATTPVDDCDCEVVDSSHYLDRCFTFVGVAYWGELPELAPKLFRNATESDSLAYAGVRVFVPRPRLQWHYVSPGSGSGVGLGGQPGDILPPLDPVDRPPTDTGTGRWVVGRQGVPIHWDLLNQHWTCQLAPARLESLDSLATILQTVPPLSEFSATRIRLPNLGSLSSREIDQISPH